MGLASYRTAPPCCIVRLSGHVTVIYSYFAALPYPVTTSRSSDFGQRREPDELTDHHRPRAMGARHPRFSSPFAEGIHASRMLAQPQSQPERQDLNLYLGSHEYMRYPHSSVNLSYVPRKTPDMFKDRRVPPSRSAGLSRPSLMFIQMRRECTAAARL